MVSCIVKKNNFKFVSSVPPFHLHHTETKGQLNHCFIAKILHTVDQLSASWTPCEYGLVYSKLHIELSSSQALNLHICNHFYCTNEFKIGKKKNTLPWWLLMRPVYKDLIGGVRPLWLLPIMRMGILCPPPIKRRGDQVFALLWHSKSVRFPKISEYRAQLFLVVA